jgi:diguanylate cyclase
MEKFIRVLVVGDSEDDTQMLVSEIRKGGFEIQYQTVNTAIAMSNALIEKSWDLVISDYNMPTFNGYDALKLFKRTGLDCSFILVSDAIPDETAVATVRAGADEYVRKENLKWLLPAIERQLKQAEVRRQWNKANEKLQHIAYHDITTELPNYAFLRERLEYAISNAEREKYQGALLIMKASRFRQMNEALGDQLFDILLMQFARRVSTDLDPSFTFACLRSNEFAVLIPVVTATASAVQVVQNIIKALEAPFIIGQGLELEIQVSIGVALFPQHATAPDLLIRRARAALGEARKNRSPYLFYSGEGEEQQSRRHQLSLVSDLRRAIIENELLVFYQPKVDLRTLQVTGVEALVRWKHPRLGILAPDRFVPLAEQTGLIMPLTLSVLNEALRQCRAWNQASRQMTVAVNLSPWNLQSSVLPEQIRGLLTSAGVSPLQLELEITESAIMTNIKQATEILTVLKEMGLRLSVDDFGTGYSSLAHLHRLPIDTIKIDQSFVMKMASEPNDAVIVRSMIHLAHNLSLTVVAEGVENRETLRMLVTMGCDTAQGYYISHPRPAEELSHNFDWLQKEA